MRPGVELLEDAPGEGALVKPHAPHLAYRDAGVPGLIPPNAVLVVEVEILTEREPEP